MYKGVECDKCQYQKWSWILDHCTIDGRACCVKNFGNCRDYKAKVDI